MPRYFRKYTQGTFKNEEFALYISRINEGMTFVGRHL